MKPAPLIAAALLGILIAGVGFQCRAKSKAQWLAADPQGKALIQQALPAIQAYHKDQPRTGAILRVVYFHPSDRDPLPDYEARLDRAMQDISGFYRNGLHRFGVESEGVPYEKTAEGRLKLHLVRGKKPSSAYSYSSGNEIEAEIADALSDTMNLNKKYVLAIHALCEKAPDGRYVFHSPYYGSERSGGGSGFCHVADCELLDPALLKETSRKMVFTEHYYPRREVSVGGFNSLYLGGTAHELGHALSLSHDGGMIDEQPFGTSLMSNGNHFYRNEVRGDPSPAYLSRVSALSLISHSLLTSSDLGRWNSPKASFKDLSFTAEGATMHVRGQIVSAIPAYAMVAYVWETAGDEHFATPFVVIVKGDGKFDLALEGLKPNAYTLRLTSMHVNGSSQSVYDHYSHDAKGIPV